MNDYKKVELLTETYNMKRPFGLPKTSHPGLCRRWLVSLRVLRIAGYRKQSAHVHQGQQRKDPKKFVTG